MVNLRITNLKLYLILFFEGIHGIQHHMREYLFFKYPLLPATHVEETMVLFVNQSSLNNLTKKYAVSSCISYFVSCLTVLSLDPF